MCRSLGFQSAQGAFEGEIPVTNDTCPVELGSNKTTCGDLEAEISMNCKDLDEGIIICKGIIKVQMDVFRVISVVNSL